MVTRHDTHIPSFPNFERKDIAGIRWELKGPITASARYKPYFAGSHTRSTQKEQAAPGSSKRAAAWTRPPPFPKCSSHALEQVTPSPAASPQPLHLFVTRCWDAAACFPMRQCRCCLCFKLAAWCCAHLNVGAAVCLLLGSMASENPTASSQSSMGESEGQPGVVDPKYPLFLIEHLKRDATNGNVALFWPHITWPIFYFFIFSRVSPNGCFWKMTYSMSWYSCHRARDPCFLGVTH